jgi:hypothetical protein
LAVADLRAPDQQHSKRVAVDFPLLKQAMGFGALASI